MILLTAFEPFGGASVNASLEAARLLEKQGNGSVSLHILPVVRHESVRLALSSLTELQNDGISPRLFIALGEAGPESIVRLEKAYLNWDDYRIPDNAGNQPRDEAIAPNAPAAYFSALPVSRLEAALAEKTPLPVRVSLSAGAFLCNHTAYAISHALAAASAPVPFLFIHVPAWRPSDGEEALQKLATTLQAIVNLALEM